MSKPIIIPSTAVPPQILPPMPAGSTSINDAGIKIQQQQAQSIRPRKGSANDSNNTDVRVHTGGRREGAL